MTLKTSVHTATCDYAGHRRSRVADGVCQGGVKRARAANMVERRQRGASAAGKAWRRGKGVREKGEGTSGAVFDAEHVAEHREDQLHHAPISVPYIAWQALLGALSHGIKHARKQRQRCGVYRDGAADSDAWKTRSDVSELGIAQQVRRQLPPVTARRTTS